MNSPEIDMELLRRMADLREALHVSDGVSTEVIQALKGAAAAAVDRAASAPREIAELLSVIQAGVATVPWDAPDAVAHFADATLAGLDAIERYLFDPDGLETRRVLEGALADLQSCATGGDAAGGEPVVALDDTSDRSLDDLAALLVRMDPEDRGQTMTLDETVR